MKKQGTASPHFTPGAGCMPPALVGRDKLPEEADILFTRVMKGLSSKNMLLHGLRGVGKNVANSPSICREKAIVAAAEVQEQRVDTSHTLSPCSAHTSAASRTGQARGMREA